MGVKIEQGIWTETEGWARFPEGQSGIVRSVLSIEAQVKGFGTSYAIPRR